MLKIAALVIVMLPTPPVKAAFFSSIDLYHWLENDLNGVETYQGGMGKGYLMGAIDMLSGAIPKVVCYPSGISALKLKMVVYDYMRNHPDQMNNAVDKLVYQALTQQWPCQ